MCLTGIWVCKHVPVILLSSYSNCHHTDNLLFAEPNWPVLLPGYTFSVNDIHGADGEEIGPGLTTYLAEAAASLLFRKHTVEEVARAADFDATNS